MNRRMIVVAVVVVFAAHQAAAVEVALEYVCYDNAPTLRVRPSGGARIRALSEVPSGDWELPDFACARPVFGLLELGDGARLLALDRKQPDDAFYGVLYFDVNGNGDLTEEEPLEGAHQSPDGRTHMVDFPVISTTVDLTGHALPYSLRILAMGLTPGDSASPQRSPVDGLQVFANVNCAYTGRFELDGETYSIVLSDRNGNGRFDDSVSLGDRDIAPVEGLLVPDADELYLAPSIRPGGSDGMLLADFLVVGGRLFEVVPDLAANKLVLTPTDEPLVPVPLSMKVERLHLYGGTGGRSVAMFRPEEEVTLPAGTYRVLNYQALREDEDGGTWRALAFATTETPALEVGTGARRTLTFGEPYVPTVFVSARSRERVKDGVQQIPIELRIVGAANEVVLDVRRISGGTKWPDPTGSRPKEAEYRIVKADGERVAQGKFEYG
jgi:hypothetical protein